jgi:hypothetical protein
MIDYILILENNYPGTQWIIDGDSSNYNNLIWHDVTPQPTQDELDSQWESVQATIASKLYRSQRAQVYPYIGDQLDMIWHAIDNGTPLDQTSTFYQTIKQVKDTYPKG